MALLKHRRKGRDFFMLVAVFGAAWASGCSFKPLDHLNAGDAGRGENTAKSSGGDLSLAGFGNAGRPNSGTGGDESSAGAGGQATAGMSGTLGSGAESGASVGGSAGDSGASGAANAGAAGTSVVPQGQAVLVVGAIPLNASDAIFAERLKIMGYNVTPSDDNDIGGLNFDSADVVAITRSIESEVVGNQVRELGKPIVVWEPMLYDELGMVQRMNGGFGIVTGLKGINILNEKSPLAAGLKGEVVVANVLGEIAFGTPNDAADRVAGTPGESGRATIFAYEKGADMPRLRAPERRVGLFFSDHTAESATNDAWRLFEAAVRWADGN
jgi:hypothetical protein